MELDSLLAGMAGHNASDLFLKAPAPPCYKISGRVHPTPFPPLSPEDVEKLALHVLHPRDLATFEHDSQVDFGYALRGVGRFRGNCYRQRGTVAMVFRRINTEVPTIESLGLPNKLKELAMEPRGLVLVTGATGSGKSTTLAAMIDFRNSYSQGHIVTLEDPIEFLHPDKGCVISQREIGVDVADFHDGLRAALRQAPDVLLMGEIRDNHSAEAALHLSETGHLVMGTLHSTNANQAVERLLQLFPSERHGEILGLLALNLRGIISQRLILGLDGQLHLAAEILLGTPRVKEIIKRAEVHDLKAAIESGIQDGMQTFDQSIYDLYLKEAIDQESALLAADSPNDLKLKMRGFVNIRR